MIGFLRGRIEYVSMDYCFLDVNGVGYRVMISEETRRSLLEGDIVKLYTYLHVREDAMLLHGFLTEAEHDLFLLLLSVSGIGPKVAMGILSGLSVEAIKAAIAMENIPLLVKLPGIGKKSAERLVLELKDKIKDVDVYQKPVVKSAISVEMPAISIVDEVVQALESLGYTAHTVRDIVEALAQEHEEVSTLLRAVLVELGKQS